MSIQLRSGNTNDLAEIDATSKGLKVQIVGNDLKSQPVYISPSNHDFTKDAFERLRVSEPILAFEYNFSTGFAADIWEAAAVAAGTATANPNSANTTIATLTTAGSGYWAQTYHHIRYAPGISTVFRATFNFVSLISGLRQRIGMFTDQGVFPSINGDGIYLEAYGTTINIVLRSFINGVGSETRVEQSSWNIDPLNGTGASGINLDWTKAQHMVLQFPWLGVGPILFGFETNNGVQWAHSFNVINSITDAYSRTGTLPVRVETHATAILSQPGNLKLINCCVIQEGNTDFDRRPLRKRSGNSGTIAKTGGTAAGLYPLVGLRAAITNDITKRGTIIPTTGTIAVTAAATGATSLQWALVIPTTAVAGATFAVINGNTQIDNAATSTTAITGSIVSSGVLPNETGLYTLDFNELRNSIARIGQNAVGNLTATYNSIFLCIGPLSGTATVAATAVAAINWSEMV